MKRALAFLALACCTKSSADTLFGGVDAGPAQVAPKDSSAAKAAPPLRVT